MNPVLFPGPRISNSPTSSVLPSLTGPSTEKPKPRPGFSPLSGFDGWIPMTPNLPPQPLAPVPVVEPVQPLPDAAANPVNQPAVPLSNNVNARVDQSGDVEIEQTGQLTVPAGRNPVTVSPVAGPSPIQIATSRPELLESLQPEPTTKTKPSATAIPVASTSIENTQSSVSKSKPEQTEPTPKLSSSESSLSLIHI